MCVDGQTSDAGQSLFERLVSSDVSRGVNVDFEGCEHRTLAASDGLLSDTFDASPSGF